MASKCGDYVRSCGKLNTLYLHLQKTHEHQTRQGAGLQSETPILKVILPFDHVTNSSSLDNFKNLYFHYYKSCGTQTLKSSLTLVLLHSARALLSNFKLWN